MAVPGSRKRSANVGHHTLGAEVALPDGTKAFQATTTLSDPENLTAVAAVVKDLDGPGYSASTKDLQLAGIAATLIRIEQNQREMFEALINKLS